MSQAQTDFLSTLTLILVVLILGGMAFLVVLGEVLNRRDERPRSWKPPQHQQPQHHDSALYPDLPNDHMLILAPLIPDPVTGVMLTLRKYLMTYHELGRNVWAEVVTNFYNRAALDNEIADYFAGVDLIVLQSHFLAALMTVTGEGLTVGTVRHLHDRHRDVRNSKGVLITPVIYDRTAGTLVVVIRDALRQTKLADPDPVLKSVQRMALVLREYLIFADSA